MNPKVRSFMVKIFWTVVTAGLGVLCLSAMNHKKHMTLQGMHVDLEGSEEDVYFMKPADIEREISKVIGPLDKHQVGNVSCDVIEDVLSKNPFIEKVEVYVSGNAKLTAKITQREPVLRVIADGHNFYVDKNGTKMPMSTNHTARVHVFTGPGAATQTKEVLNLVLHMQEDEFMNAFIEQIHTIGQGEVMLIPKIGKAQIIFGKPDRILEKFENLKAFYSEVVAETGWNKYSTIDLRYRDQIICKKNPTS